MKIDPKFIQDNIVVLSALIRAANDGNISPEVLEAFGKQQPTEHCILGRWKPNLPGELELDYQNTVVTP